MQKQTNTDIKLFYIGLDDHIEIVPVKPGNAPNFKEHRSAINKPNLITLKFTRQNLPLVNGPQLGKYADAIDYMKAGCFVRNPANELCLLFSKSLLVIGENFKLNVPV